MCPAKRRPAIRQWALARPTNKPLHPHVDPVPRKGYSPSKTSYELVSRKRTARAEVERTENSFLLEGESSYVHSPREYPKYRYFRCVYVLHACVPQSVCHSRGTLRVQAALHTGRYGHKYLSQYFGCQARSTGMYESRLIDFRKVLVLFRFSSSSSSRAALLWR